MGESIVGKNVQEINKIVGMERIEELYIYYKLILRKGGDIYEIFKSQSRGCVV